MMNERKPGTPEAGPDAAWTRAEAVFLAAALTLFAALAAYRWWVPGTVYDGMHDEYRASLLLDHARAGNLWHSLQGPLGRVGLYHGNVQKFPLMAVFALFGEGWGVVRSIPVFWGLLALWLTYLFVRAAFGRRAAVLAVLLLALDPTYHLATRLGSSGSNHMQVLTLGVLVLLERWRRTGSRRDAAVAGVLLGVGLATRLHFTWFWAGLAAVAACWAAAHPDNRAALRRAAPALAAGWLAGVAPVVVSELAADSAGWRRTVEITSFLARPDGPVELLRNLMLTFMKLNVQLSGKWWVREVFSADGGNAFFPVVVWASALFLLWAVRHPEKGREDARRWAAACLILFAVMFVAAAAVRPQKITRIHLAFLYPFPLVFVAAAVDEALRRWGRSRAVGALPWAVLAAFLGLQAAGLGQVLRWLKHPGGTAGTTDSIYDVARALETGLDRPGPLVCLDHNQFRSLYFLRPSDRGRRVLIGKLSEVPPTIFPMRPPGFYVLTSRRVEMEKAMQGYRPGRVWYEAAGRMRPVRRFHDAGGEWQAMLHYVELPRE
jgi:hypothetical protein